MRKLKLLLILAILSSCVKDKSDNKIPLLDVSNKSLSAIRMFNFTGIDLDVTVNNIPLTAYPDPNNINHPGQATQVGLSIFSSGVWTATDNGSPFVVPNSLLDKNNKIRLRVQPRDLSGLVEVTLDTTIENNVMHPLDYYLQANGTIKIITRDNVPPANGQNFKVRIINLGRANDTVALNGPVSMTYADGSPVSDLLNNVAEISPYAELPYGAYQFKVFVAAGAGIDPTKQFAELPQFPNFNPCMPVVLSQEAIPSRLRTFKPGGVYSIVITPNYFIFFNCDRTSRSIITANSYRIVTEVDPGVNYSYARMQAVNALPGKQITVKVDGQPLGGTLDYIGNTTPDVAQSPEYKIFIQGSHKIEAVDQSGNVLATGNINLYPYDNYTIWAYEKPDGKADLLFESNDMTGSVYTPSDINNGGQPDDGTDGNPRRVRYNYAVESRFLNFSPDLPFATFTNDQQYFLPYGVNGSDTVRFPGAYTALAPGTQPFRNPNIIYSVGPFQDFAVVNGQRTEVGILPSLIRVWQSKPGERPGTLLSGIAPLNAANAYIANPALYRDRRPLGENGVYTVALVGNTFKGTKARIILIKHNK